MTRTPLPRAATGVSGLDDILGGGLIPNRLYLLEGMPGSGKTTLAGGSALPSTAAAISAAATTTTPSAAAGSRCTRAWSPPSTGSKPGASV